MNRRLVLIAGLSLVSGCATLPSAVARPAGAPLEELEPVYLAQAGRQGLTVRVASNGCTRREDFAFYVERKGGAATVAFARKRLDPCRSFAMGHADLAFTYDELGVSRSTPLFVLNPLVAWTGPGS